MLGGRDVFMFGLVRWFRKSLLEYVLVRLATLVVGERSTVNGDRAAKIEGVRWLGIEQGVRKCSPIPRIVGGVEGGQDAHFYQLAAGDEDEVKRRARQKGAIERISGEQPQ